MGAVSKKIRERRRHRTELAPAENRGPAKARVVDKREVEVPAWALPNWRPAGSSSGFAPDDGFARWQRERANDFATVDRRVEYNWMGHVVRCSLGNTNMFGWR